MGNIYHCYTAYIDEPVVIVIDKYTNNGRPAISLFATDGEPIARVTVNIPDAPLGKREILIKDYSENEGILNWMVASGLVEDTGKVIPAGHAVVNIVRMTPKLIWEGQ